MKSKNKCTTYFKIVGNLDPEYVTLLLDIPPKKTHNAGERVAKSVRLQDGWEGCYCEEYDVIVSNQMEATIAPLSDKVALLNSLREQTGAVFYLEVVPHIYAGEINPCLAPSLKVIDFCHDTRTEIDIDMYVYDTAK